MIFGHDSPEAETRLRLAGELLRAAATAGGSRFRGSLLASANELSKGSEPKPGRQVYAVHGEEMGDTSCDRWICCLRWHNSDAASIANSLNEIVAGYGRSISNPLLVGLEPGQRSELSRYLAGIDPLVKVGRHGVRWFTTPMRCE